MNRTPTLLVVLPLAALLCGSALASPAAPQSAPAAAPAPSVDWRGKMKRINDFYVEQEKAGTPIEPAAIQALVDELLADVRIDQLSLDDLEAGWNVIGQSPKAAAEGRARLETFIAAPDAQGARAAFMLARTSRWSEPDGWAARAGAALDHPGVDAFLAERGPQGIMQYSQLLSGIPEDQRGAYVDRFVAFSDRFTSDMNAGELRSVGSYVMSLRDLGDAVGKERFDATRTKVLGVVEGAAAKAREAGRTDEAEVLEKLARRLDSPAMRGELLGNPAPAMTFEWIQDPNGTPTWTSLEDLKGKVVVLDFWATWCGPCVGSFPNVRELREHYPAEDVAIIGVTSLQGAHYWRKNEALPDRPGKIDTKDNAALERELMAEYMKEMDITWAIAFSKEEVFNPDYDVNGIPHVAIIDAEGRIRFNGLHPAMPMQEKTDKIDQLLREAGRTPPPAPAPAAEK